MTDWLHIQRSNTPLIVSVPHAGTQLPQAWATGLLRPLALHDTDWFVDRLYADAPATIIRTSISRSIIDVNRDPSGASLYPGQVTTGLCPETTFAGEPLYGPDAEIDVPARRTAFFDPYHAALKAEISRLRALHPVIVLYDAHSILSRAPRLFDGVLPQFNIGTYDGIACDPALGRTVAECCGTDHVIDGRFKGGWITRHYGNPQNGVHAIQMELAMRGYCDEAIEPPQWHPQRAAMLQHKLQQVLSLCLDFAKVRA